MKRLIPLAAVFVLPLVAFSLLALALPLMAGPLPAGEGGIDGKAIFLANKCEMCHSVSTAGIEAKSKAMKAPDLVGVVTAQHDAKWIAQYLKKAADLEGKKHGKEFKGSDEELQALVDWLGEQKAK